MKNLNIGIIAMGAAIGAVVLASNILVQFPIGNWLTWGAFTYPFAFLITDLTNRFYGVAAARRVVYSGLIVGLACSFVGTQITGEFGPLVTLRIAIGSAAAFLMGQLLDVAIFDRLRAAAWWRAPFISTLVGSAVDTAIFFTIAFSAGLIWIEPANDVTWANELVPLLGFGPIVALWVSLALADFAVKIAVDLGALLPFRLAIAKYAQRAV
ncbi:MAG: queuosine precursor transporter [Cypionkella sp.]|nr:queuosine precursor transporter [Cypionkella sp.]